MTAPVAPFAFPIAPGRSPVEAAGGAVAGFEALLALLGQNAGGVQPELLRDAEELPAADPETGSESEAVPADGLAAFLAQLQAAGVSLTPVVNLPRFQGMMDSGAPPAAAFRPEVGLSLAVEGADAACAGAPIATDPALGFDQADGPAAPALVFPSEASEPLPSADAAGLLERLRATRPADLPASRPQTAAEPPLPAKPPATAPEAAAQPSSPSEPAAAPLTAALAAAPTEAAAAIVGPAPQLKPPVSPARGEKSDARAVGRPSDRPAVPTRTDEPSAKAEAREAGDAQAQDEAAFTPIEGAPLPEPDLPEPVHTRSAAPLPVQGAAAEGAAPLPAAVQPVRGAPETVARLAAGLIEKLEAQVSRFDLQLDPLGLGKVDVSVEIDATGKLAASLTFDNAQAAQDLRGRAGELRQSLEQAGFTLSEGSLNFDFTGQRQGQESSERRPASPNAQAFARLVGGLEDETAPIRYQARRGLDLLI